MTDKSFDELLAELDIEEEKDQEPTPAPQEKGDNFKQLRDYTKRQERELKQLREFREQAVQKERLGALQAAGLTEAQSNIYLKVYEDVTSESVEAFKTNVLGVATPAPATAPETPQETAPEPRTTGFAPTSGGVPVGKPMITRAEFDKMIKNPATRPEAVRALNEGRVQLNNETAYDIQVTDTAGLFRRNI